MIQQTDENPKGYRYKVRIHFFYKMFDNRDSDILEYCKTQIDALSYKEICDETVSFMSIEDLVTKKINVIIDNRKY